MASSAVDNLNSALRGAISAVETYEQGLAKLGDEPAAADVRRIHQEHVEAVSLLRQHVQTAGGTPSSGSGVWGAFANAVEGTARLFGNAAALRALQEGERHGVNTYESVLEDKTLPAEAHADLQRLLARQREHIQTLDTLMKLV